MTARSFATVAVLALAASVPGPAGAHGFVQSSDPEGGARVRNVPEVVSVEFTESPTADSRFEVLDGCGDDVLAGVAGEGRHAELAVGGGEPGRWRVRFRVVSSVDGHPTSGSFRFRVAGRPDCSQPEPGETEGPDVAQPDPGEDEPAARSFPAGPVLVGGATIVVLALVVRLLSSRGS